MKFKIPRFEQKKGFERPSREIVQSPVSMRNYMRE